MKRRILGLLLAVLMLVGMIPASVISVSAAESSIYVGSVKLPDKSYLVNGATKTQTTKPSSTGYAYYSNGELHLYGYRYTGAGIYGEGGSSTCAGILSKGTLKIVLHGNSTIDMDDTDSSRAIHTLSNLTIIAADGDTNASLKLKNCTDGIDAGGTVNINSGSVDITSQKYGIYAAGSFGMTKGSLSVWTDSDDGIYVSNIVLITGGNINIISDGNGINAAVSYGQIGGNVTVYSNSIGISASSTTAATAVLVNGGSLNVNGVTHAINSSSDVKFTKCAVELQSVDGAAIYSCRNPITFENLTTLASGGLSDPMGPYSFAKNSSYRYIKAYDISTAEVIVGGVGMIGGMYLSADTMLLSKSKPSGGYAYYADGVLTLNNFSYQGEGHVLTSGSNRIANGIYSTTDLTIKLSGNNALDIKMGSGNGHSNGIEVLGSLNIIRHDDTSSGSLTISNSSYGISHKGLAVTGVDITLSDADMTGIFGNNGSSFFMGFGNLTITDSTSGIYGSVYMVGGNVDIRTTGHGIYGCETFAITGGNLAITNDSYGIDCTKKFHVNGGNLTINTTGECGVCCTDGVDANIEKGTASISADGYAVYASSINIENGNVTLISNNVKKDDSYGAMGTETGKVTFGDGLTVQVSKNADGSAPEAFVLKDYFKYDYVYVTNQVSKVAFNLSGYRAGNRMTDLVLTGPDSAVTYSGYLNVSKFVEGTSYDFEVLLTWKDGISFNGDPAKDITLDGRLPKSVEKKSSGDGYVLTYALPACPGQSVSEVGVYGLDAPVPGAHPDFTAYVSNPYAYKFSRYGEDGCGFYWFDSEGVPLSATDTFEAGKTYSLEIKLEPNMDNGVTSFKTPVTATLNGNYTDKMANSKNVYITETFVCNPAVLVAGVGMIDGDYLAVGATKTQRTKPSGGYAYLKGKP